MHKFKYILEATAQLRWFKCSRLLFNKHQIQCVFFSALSGVLLFLIAEKVSKKASGWYFGFVRCKFNLKQHNSLRSDRCCFAVVILKKLCAHVSRSHGLCPCVRLDIRLPDFIRPFFRFINICLKPPYMPHFLFLRSKN